MARRLFDDKADITLLKFGFFVDGIEPGQCPRLLRLIIAQTTQFPGVGEFSMMIPDLRPVRAASPSAVQVSEAFRRNDARPRSVPGLSELPRAIPIQSRPIAAATVIRG